jgi:hypothetical protein
MLRWNGMTANILAGGAREPHRKSNNVYDFFTTANTLEGKPS